MKKVLLIISGFLPLAEVAVMFKALPDQVPVHFGASGAPDRFGSKSELLIFAVIMLLLAAAMFAFVTIQEKKQKNSEKDSASAKINAGVVCITGIVVELAITAACGMSLYYALNETMDTTLITKLALIIVGLVLIVTGNYLPKTKRNSYIGLRTAHSMYNDTTWLKSNRFCGYTCMAGGALTAVLALILSGTAAIISMLVILSLAITASIVYSEMVYKEVSKSE